MELDQDKTQLYEHGQLLLALVSTTWPCSLNETPVCPDLNSDPISCYMLLII